MAPRRSRAAPPGHKVRSPTGREVRAQAAADDLVAVLRAIAGGARRAGDTAHHAGLAPARSAVLVDVAGWLGLIDSGELAGLTTRGLEVALAPEARTEATLAATLWRSSVVVDLLAGQPRAPLLKDLVARLCGPPHLLAAPLARGRARVLRDLSDLLVTRRPARTRSRGAQLALPFRDDGPRPPAGMAATVTEGLSLGSGPDLYARVLTALLDAGELTPENLHAILEGLGGHGGAVAQCIQLALERGDAVRVDWRLAVTPGAIARRALADDPVLVALTQPSYRRGLEAALADSSGDRRSERDRAWDQRVFGAALEPARAAELLERVLPSRSLRSLPLAEHRPHACGATGAPFLELVDQPLLDLALPSSLVALCAPLDQLNARLRGLRRQPHRPRLPGPLQPRARTHAGLVPPGLPLPRVLPDRRTLRLAALSACPAVALGAALTMLSRTPAWGARVALEGDAALVWWRGRPRGSMVAIVRRFALAQGWRVSWPPSGGLRSGELAAVLEAIDVATRVGGVLTVDERVLVMFDQDAEAHAVGAGLRQLSARLQEWLDSSEGEE